MQNIDVRFNASSNFRKVEAELAALQAQAASLGNVFTKNAYATPPAVTDVSRWKAASRAVHEASNVYRAAASSSGLLSTQQIRATSEAEKYTKALQKQKLTLSDMRKHSGIMKQVYQDQLRYQRMTAQYWGTDSAGRAITDITIPKSVPRDLDTAAQRMHFLGQRVQSASTQMINFGKNAQWAGRQLTVGFTYPLGLIGVAAGVMAYKVDEAMTRVTKVYDVSAEAQKNEAMRVKELAQVRERSWALASTAAEKYGQSVEQTLEIEQRLAATGLNGEELYKSTEAVSRIATLGDLNVEQSTDMTIALQTAFKDTIKTSEDLTRTFDFMNAVENATSLGLQDIAEATPRAASGLAQLGVTAEQMTVLMVSMREAGVNAAEGANALKSATTRILNPAIVKKATDLYESFGANIDVQNIVDQSGGNLYEFIRMLGEATAKNEKLTQQQKASAIAALFGTYQFNRLNAALVNVGDAYTDTQNQARKAIDLMNADAKTLGDSAEQEIAQKMEAASGRFQAAWQEMRVELAKAGEPFLAVATYAADAAGSILGFFNGMDDWKKKALLGVAAVMAIAGPLVMLGGLAANLGGQFYKGIGRTLTVLGKLGGAVSLVTKEERAAALTAEAQNTAMMKQQQTTSTLAKEVQVLTAAYEKATIAARNYAQTQGVANASQAGAAITPAMARTPSGGRFAAWSNDPLPATNVAANRQATRDAQERLNYARAEAEANARSANQMKLYAASGALATASMATMMFQSNETADNIAKWALIGSLVVPMLSGAAGWMGKIVTDTKAAAALQLTNMRNAASGTAAVGAMGRAMNVAKAGAIGFGASLNAALGPVGWIALGLTAVVGTFMVIKNHQDKIREEQKRLVDEQVEATKKMQSSTASIATNLGKAAGSYRQIVNAGGAAQGGTGSQSQMLKSYNYYKSEEGSEETKALQFDGKLIDTDALMDKVRGKFIDLQVLGSDTAEQAKTDIQAMLLAAGASATQAADMAEEVYREYGSVNKIDWAKPIEDQTKALDTLARDAFKLNTELITGNGFATYVSDFEIDEGAKKKLYAQAEKSTEIFNQALATAASPEEAREIIDQYMQAATSEWQTGFDTLMSSNVDGSDKVKALFKQYGIDSGEAFAAAMREDGAFEEAYLDLSTSPNVNYQLQGQLQYAREFATEYEHAFINPLAESSWYLSDSVLTAATALKQFNEAGIGLNADQAADKLMQENETYKEYADAVARVNELKRQRVPENSQQMLDAQNDLNKKAKALIPIINELNQQYGFKQGKTAAKALAYLLGQVAFEADGAKDKVKGVDNALDQMETRKTVTIEVKQVGGIIQSAMSNVQGRMADSAMNAFNDRWDSSLQAAQDSWDARQDALQASHEAASNALDRQQENAQDAFDRRWEARKDAIEKAYDRRIKAVEREIESERKADEVRQQLFEKEKARLARLAELENTNIDFNTALNEGRLDDAAKTLNNAGADAGNAQMEAEQAAAEKRTEARIKALEKKNERLEKERDKELENLEKLEERMRKHLERVQDARRRALEKQQAQEVKALENSEEAAMDSMERQRNYEEAMLQERLELFKAYTARNQKDLEKWMKQVGLSYDDFGEDVKAKGEKWSTYFRKELSKQIRQAGTEVMNDNIWENVGKGIANKLLKGLGFDNLAQFNRFVKTGSKGGGGKGGKGDDTETRHEGGMIGTGGGSRKGVPNTYKGLHRSEKMVRAQKGEYMINRKAAKSNLPLLEAINSGTDVGGIGGLPEGMTGVGTGIGSAGYGGPVGMLAGAMSQMFAKGVGQAFNNAYQVGLAKQQAKSASGRYAGAAGTYGGRAFSAAQMKNAAIIASVGAGMGMSKRDIMIGIMTAITESGLVNVNYGDRDSLGLFQQRPSMGWGTAAQVTNPRYSSGKFFSVLKGHAERGEEAPWLAAQHVQRSAYADGSNYAKWWAAAQAIFNNGLTKKRGGGVNGGYVAGSGGRHRPINGPVTNGLHGGSSAGNPPAVDMAGPTGRPVYAVSDGVITQSRDIAGPLPTDTYRGDGPYGSFGRMIQMRTGSGAYVLYAHLSRRSVAAGQNVKGGSVIGYSGNTGNSSGAHLHFGATNGPYAWLRRGGTVKYDNTPAVLHKGETVLTERLTRKFADNVGGGGETFHVTLDLRGAMIKEDVDIEKAVNKAIDARENKLGRKRVVR